MLAGMARVLGGIPKGLLPSTGLIMAAIAVFGYAAVDVSWVRDSQGTGSSPLYDTDFTQILARNLGAALVLYSGVVTLGRTTVIGSGILALYIGATVSLGLNSVGGATLFADVIWYVPFEFLGLVMAATAGLQPRRTGGPPHEERARVCRLVRRLPRALPGHPAHRRRPDSPRCRH